MRNTDVLLHNMAKVEKAVALNICRLKMGKNLYKVFCPNSTPKTKKTYPINIRKEDRLERTTIFERPAN
jgi:hypothetical protein